jgi:hypothetical protein
MNNKKSPLNYRTALLFSVSISLLMNMLFLIMLFYGKSNVRMNEPEPVQHIFRLDLTVMRIFFNFLVAFILYLLYFGLLKNKWFSSRENRIYNILIVLVCTAIISYLCSVVHLQFDDFGKLFNDPPGEAYRLKPPGNTMNFIAADKKNMEHHFQRIIIGGMFRDYLIAIVVILSSELLYLSNKQQKIALENEMLQAEYMKTRFMALKNQVDPHFLFNSLNTLSALIKTDANKAEEYVQQLSNVLRYTLQNKEIITLEEELKFTMAYCHLMQIRYGDNLQFVQKVNEKYYPYSIVPLSLQTLVENAIKHNVVSNRQPLTITFFTSENATITVSNQIQPKKDVEKGENIGLSNLAERYRLLWKKEIAVRTAGGVFEVEIPLIA